MSVDWLEWALALLRKFEGLRLEAYPDPISGGKPWTIGYGATGAGIRKGTVWTRAQAEVDLRRRVVEVFEPGIRKAVHDPLADHQRVALISLVYNIGLENFEVSTLLRKLNAGDLAGAAAEFPKWRKAEGRVVPALEYRRREEQALFLRPAA